VKVGFLPKEHSSYIWTRVGLGGKLLRDDVVLRYQGIRLKGSKWKGWHIKGVCGSARAIGCKSNAGFEIGASASGVGG
jgi:hypothetical protein